MNKLMQQFFHDKQKTKCEAFNFLFKVCLTIATRRETKSYRMPMPISYLYIYSMVLKNIKHQIKINKNEKYNMKKKNPKPIKEAKHHDRRITEGKSQTTNMSSYKKETNMVNIKLILKNS